MVHVQIVNVQFGSPHPQVEGQSRVVRHNEAPREGFSIMPNAAMRAVIMDLCCIMDRERTA
jgi:hypothetical protein